MTWKQEDGDVRILLVEDEALIGLGMVEELTKAGHSVVGPVQSTGAALLLAQTQELDIAIIDLDLVGLQEPDRLARVLKETLGLDSLLLACETRLADVDADISIGVVAKPFDLAEMSATLAVASRIQAGGRAPPPRIPSPLRLFN